MFKMPQFRPPKVLPEAERATDQPLLPPVLPRPHRDFYVSILMENVEPGSHQNFRKESNDTHSGRGTPFDPHSIMIYGPKDFGIVDRTTGERKTTIQPCDPNVEIRYK